MTAGVLGVWAGSLVWAAVAVNTQSRMQQGGRQDSIPWALVLIAPLFNDQIAPAVQRHTGPNLNRFDPITNGSVFRSDDLDHSCGDSGWEDWAKFSPAPRRGRETVDSERF